jgi:hypothetical protein
LEQSHRCRTGGVYVMFEYVTAGYGYQSPIVTATDLIAAELQIKVLQQRDWNLAVDLTETFRADSELAHQSSVSPHTTQEV